MFTVIDEKTILLSALPKDLFSGDELDTVILDTLSDYSFVQEAIAFCEEHNLKGELYGQECHLELSYEVDDRMRKSFQNSWGLFLEFNKPSDLIYFKMMR